MRVAVVGCGPRAVAIAAKCAGLASIGRSAPTVRIYEKNEAFSAWSGSSGFSNGRSLLCTPVERDVGYPYSGLTELEERMLSLFSWRSYLADGLSTGPYTLNEWFSRGRPQPNHKEFATYLRWVLDRSCSISGSIQLSAQSCVESIEFSEERKWCIVSRRTGETNVERSHFDGVVVTGLGLRSETLVSSGSPLYFNGANFWESKSIERICTKSAEKLALGEEFEVAIAGDGGTSAAIAEFLMTSGPENITVTIVGSKPFLDSRPPNFFSDRLFGDTESWQELPIASRHEFLQRTSSGRIWHQVTETLEKFPMLRHKCARVLRGEYFALGAADGFYRVHFAVDGRSPSYFAADALVDARGFDPLWFLSICSPNIASSLVPFPSLKGRIAPYIRKSLDKHFCPSISGVPDGLHLPMLGDLVNPASSNLMALGSVADAIIAKYR